MRRYSNFVLKCRILGNRLLFLHSKVDLKPLTALLQIRLNRQARHVLGGPALKLHFTTNQNIQKQKSEKIFPCQLAKGSRGSPSIHVPHNQMPWPYINLQIFPKGCRRYLSHTVCHISSTPFLSRLLHASIILATLLLSATPTRLGFCTGFFLCVFYNNPGEQKLSTCRRHQEIGAKRKGKTRRAFGNDLMTTMFWDEGNHSTDDSPVFFSFLSFFMVGPTRFGRVRCWPMSADLSPNHKRMQGFQDLGARRLNEMISHMGANCFGFVVVWLLARRPGPCCGSGWVAGKESPHQKKFNRQNLLLTHRVWSVLKSFS